MLSACVGPAIRPGVDAAAPPFAPLAFFAGRTEGIGGVKTIVARERAVRVHGRGTIAGDGSLTLVQRIEQDGKPPRTRRWSLRPAGVGQYAGALSDADGPVLVAARGNLLHIRFRAKGGLAIEQWLALQPGGRTAINLLVARKFGVRVAVLHETIRKID